MALLTAQQITTMQTAATRLLPDSCTIHDQTETTTAKGQTVTVGPALRTVACRVGHTPVQQQTGQGTLMTVRQPSITLPPGDACTSEQIIRTGGVEYEVLEVLHRGVWEITPVALVKAVNA